MIPYCFSNASDFWELSRTLRLRHYTWRNADPEVLSCVRAHIPKCSWDAFMRMHCYSLCSHCSLCSEAMEQFQGITTPWRLVCQKSVCAPNNPNCKVPECGFNPPADAWRMAGGSTDPLLQDTLVDINQVCAHRVCYSLSVCLCARVRICYVHRVIHAGSNFPLFFLKVKAKPLTPPLLPSPFPFSYPCDLQAKAILEDAYTFISEPGKRTLPGTFRGICPSGVKL
jgi:hypothetical protein